MFNYGMDMSSYFTCLCVLELLLFIAAIITYDIYLSYIFVLFGIKIFKLFKYVESMSLVSLILQHKEPNIKAQKELKQFSPINPSCEAKVGKNPTFPHNTPPRAGRAVPTRM
jgi:predicted membrane protein